MNDVAGFVRAFIEAEHRAIVAAHADPDEGRAHRLIAAAAAFLDPTPGSIVALDFGRPAGLGPAQLMDPAAAARQFHPRPLFAIAEYEGADGPLYRAVVGSTMDPDGWFYAEALTIHGRGNGLRIAGRAGVDALAPMDPIEWMPLGGVQVSDQARLVTVRAFRRPKDPTHALAHDRLIEASESADG